LGFNEQPIKFKDIDNGTVGKQISGIKKELYNKMGKNSGALSKVHPKGNFFNAIKVNRNKVLNTILASRGSCFIYSDKANEVSNEIYSLAGSFPIDYNYLNIDPKYLIGMSVPPVMMAQVSYQVYKQWLSKI